MRIAIASDHAGFEYKEKLKQLLETAGHAVSDFGTDSTEPVDYLDYIRPAKMLGQPCPDSTGKDTN